MIHGFEAKLEFKYNYIIFFCHTVLRTHSHLSFLPFIPHYSLQSHQAHPVIYPLPVPMLCNFSAVLDTFAYTLPLLSQLP